MIRNGKEMSSLSDEKCKGNVEDEKKKKKKVVCNRYAKGRRKNQKTVELKEAWQ